MNQTATFPSDPAVTKYSLSGSEASSMYDTGQQRADTNTIKQSCKNALQTLCVFSLEEIEDRISRAAPLTMATCYVLLSL